MLKNYLKVAWRNIAKRNSYSIVNIVGLSVGMAFLLLITSYVWSEFQVNRNLRNSENQYIIQSNWGESGSFNLTTVGALAKTIKDLHPDLIENYYRWDGITSTVSKGNSYFKEAIQIGDSTLLSMYGFPLLYGNPKTALDDPYSAIITKETALKYYGRINVLGEILSIESFSGTKHDFLITGILDKLPPNSVTSINDNNRNTIFLSVGCIGFFGRVIDSWNNPWIIGYLELKNGVQPKELERLMLNLVKKNTPLGISNQMKPALIPLREYYLQANNGLVKKMVSTLTIIALFILLMAVVNFINISVSKSSSRMREIGVRQVLGGRRKDLIFQFLSESFVLVFLSTLFALGLYTIFNPGFSHMLDTEIPSIFFFPTYVYGIFFAGILFISLLAGIYPAIILSSFRAAEVIKGKMSSIKENIFRRKFLVALQFGIATIVLISAILISKQVSFFLNSNLGYEKAYVITAQVPRDWSQKGIDHLETVRNEFVKLPLIEDATLSYEIPDGNPGDVPNAFKPGEDSTKAKPVEMFKTDGDYLSTYKIPLVAGSFFKESNEQVDSTKIVLNETAAQTFGWSDPQMAIGRQLKFQGFNGTLFNIVGVTKDFQTGTMQSKTPPIIFFHLNFYKQFRYFSFRVKPGNTQTATEALGKRWANLLPGAPFEYRFMDDVLKKIYKSELQLQQAALTASVLAGIIVLMGVLGLVSLSIEKRRKEIGIRKVLGSSMMTIIMLFVKEFLLIILIGGLVACPLAYMIIQKWLNGYAYRIQITAQPFLFSIVLFGLITVILIIFQSSKAANVNPVQSLRAE